jgi:hypothetical protein
MPVPMFSDSKARQVADVVFRYGREIKHSVHKEGCEFEFTSHVCNVSRESAFTISVVKSISQESGCGSIFTIS